MRINILNPGGLAKSKKLEVDKSILNTIQFLYVIYDIPTCFSHKTPYKSISAYGYANANEIFRTEINKNLKEQLDENRLEIFLNKTIAFVWGYAFTNPGVNALRTPVYAEMINVVSGKDVNFDDHKFEENTLRTAINNFEFKNGSK